MILMIDNFDSFTYNIVQYLGELGAEVKVVRNNAHPLHELTRLSFSHLVVSPGPCTPKEAGISVEAIRHFGGKVPLLGVCLGHQSLGDAFGGKIIRAKKLMHGKLSSIRHDGQGVFRGLKNPFSATRYHSLVIEKKSIPKDLVITATSEDGEIMGVRHKRLKNVEGIQFHPESIMTEEGKKLLANFLKMKN